MGGSRGMMIQQMTETLVKVISRSRYSQPGRQITDKNSHANGSEISCLNIHFLRRGARKMKMKKKTEMI